MWQAKRATTHTNVDVTAAGARELVGLARKSATSGGWSFATWPEVDINRIAKNESLDLLIQHANVRMDECGYVVISFGRGLASYNEDDAAAAVTLFLTAFGNPIRVFDNLPSHWRQIDVDTTRPHNRSRGVGRQDLHMDFVNAEFPPDFVCLYCLRPDPLGEGRSLVACMDNLETRLPGDILTVLNRPAFRDGEVKNLSNVGADMNPFRVYSPGADFRFRFTTNLVESTKAEMEVRALNAVKADLEGQTISITLDAGDLLLVDQHRTLHGRLPLGSGQENLAPSDRRLVLHSFLRKK